MMADAECDAVSRVQLLQERLHQKRMDLEDAAEHKRVHIEQYIQFVHFQNEASQVSDGTIAC